MWRRNKFMFTRLRGSSADAHPWLLNLFDRWITISWHVLLPYRDQVSLLGHQWNYKTSSKNTIYYAHRLFHIQTYFLAHQFKHVRLELKRNEVKPILSGHSKVDKTKVLKSWGILMQLKSTEECSTRAFCHIFVLHYVCDYRSWNPIFWFSFEWELNPLLNRLFLDHDIIFYYRQHFKKIKKNLSTVLNTLGNIMENRAFAP